MPLINKNLHFLGDSAFTAPAVLARIPRRIDVTGRADIGSETHWVIGAKGGLAPSESLEDDVLITVSDPQQASSAKIALEIVRGG